MSKKKLYVHDLVTQKENGRTVRNDPIEREIAAADQELAADAKRLRLETIIATREQKLAKIKRTGETKKEIAQVGNEFFKGILDIAKVDPARAKEFLDSLSQEDIMKINLFSARGSGAGLQALLPLIKSDKMGVKDIVAIVKMVQPPPDKPTTISEVATLMKAFKEMEKPQSANVYDKFIKPMLDESRAMREELSKERMMRLEKEIGELRERPSFVQELAGKKSELEAFKDMFGGGTEPNLEITKMKMDQDRWKVEHNWTMQKELADMKMERQSEKDKWKMIEKIAVPAIKQLQPVLGAAVNAGKNKLNSVGNRPKTVPTKQAATSFPCPKCAEGGVQTLIDVSHLPDVAECNVCKTKFPKQAE